MIMTNREFFEKVITLCKENEEIVAHAQASINKLNEKNLKRAEKPSKTAVENEPIKVKILEYLEEKGQTVGAVIASDLGYSTNKIVALCLQLQNEGKVKKVEVKLPKVGKRMAYLLVENED